MKGFPNHLNSKADYLNIKELFPESQWRPLFLDLLPSPSWLVENKLELSKIGLSDDTHKVVEIKNSEGVVVENYQYCLKIDPNSKIFKLGFTVNEIEEILV